MKNEIEQERFDIIGAGELIISRSPNWTCGNEVGFSLDVTWGRFGETGGMIPREEARRLANLILEELSKDLKSKEEIEDVYRKQDSTKV